MKKKNIVELTEYHIYYVDLKTITDQRAISKNSLCKMTNIAYHVLQRYYKSEIKRVDLDIISHLCAALDCEISDILKKN